MTNALRTFVLPKPSERTVLSASGIGAVLTNVGYSRWLQDRDPFFLDGRSRYLQIAVDLVLGLNVESHGTFGRNVSEQIFGSEIFESMIEVISVFAPMIP